MKKYDDYEIRKSVGFCAFHHCSELSNSDYCKDCSFCNEKNCVAVMLGNAYELLESNFHEIANLRALNGEFEGEKEIEIKEAKINAVKDFAQFLIEKARNGIIYAMDIPDYVIEFNEKEETVK